MSIIHTNDIVATYWPWEWLTGDKLKTYRNALHHPLEVIDGLHRRQWVDTCIHVGAIEEIQDMPGRDMRIRFRSGVEAIETFRTKKAKAAVMAEIKEYVQ